MPQPHIDPDFQDLRFRDGPRRKSPRDDATSLFWKGVAIFLAVALAYPFYSYSVQSTLLERDVSRAVGDLDAQLDAELRDTAKQYEAAAAESAADARRRRLASVALAGSTTVGGQRVVIVSLGKASYAEAQDTICRLAERRFGTRMTGEVLRVQRHRGTRPATDLGELAC